MVFSYQSYSEGIESGLFWDPGILTCEARTLKQGGLGG